MLSAQQWPIVRRERESVGGRKKERERERRIEGERERERERERGGMEVVTEGEGREYS